MCNVKLVIISDLAVEGTRNPQATTWRKARLEAQPFVEKRNCCVAIAG
ncbi:MAG: hypothetical protein V7K63_26205 [Nostoc sp.]